MYLCKEVGMAISLQYWHTLVAQAASTLLFHKVIRQLGKHKYLQSEQTESLQCTVKSSHQVFLSMLTFAP